MQCQHVDPDEAWQIHSDVRAFNSIGVHWGTFRLSHEVSHSLCVLCLCMCLCHKHCIKINDKNCSLSIVMDQKLEKVIKT